MPLRGARGRSRLVVGLVTLMVASSMLTGVPLVGADHTGALPADQVFEATDAVDVWERSMLPLRADMSSARWTVPNALWTLEDEDGNTKDLNKDPVGVFTVGTTITLTFDQGRAQTSNLANDDVTVVAARLEESGDLETDDATTVSEALDLLTADNVNANASFELVARTALDGDGEATVQHTVSAPGQYVYLAATNESGRQGLVVDAQGNLSIDGNVTVVGVEQVAVERAQAHVPVQTSVVRGRNITFAAHSRLAGPNVSHAVVVYDEQTFINQQFTLSIDAPPSRDFDVANNSTIEHSLAAVNGIARLEGGFSALGVDLDDGRVARQVTVGTILDFIANETGQPRPQNVPTGAAVLHASVTAVNGTPNETIKVGTFANWTAGRNYQWIYVAVGDNSSDVSTAEGEILVRSAPPAATPPPRPPAARPPPGAQVAAQAFGNNRARAQVTRVRANVPVAIALPPIPAAQQAGGVLTGLTVTPRRGVPFDLDVTASEGPPRGFPALQTAGQIQPVTYFNVRHTIRSADVAGVSFRIQVSQARLDALGADPDDVAMYRYVDGEGWVELEIERVGEADGFYVFDVASPGLSAFAIGVKTASIGIVDASLESTSVTAGEPARISATLENTGTAAGEFAVELRVDGSVVETQTVSVPAGGTATVTFERTFESPGRYRIAVGGASAGTLAVSAAETPTETAVPETPTEAPPGAVVTTPGPGGAPFLPIREPGSLGLTVIGIVIVVVVVAGLLVYRRRQL